MQRHPSARSRDGDDNTVCMVKQVPMHLRLKGLDEAVVATCMVSGYTNISGQWTCPSASSVGLRAPGPTRRTPSALVLTRIANYTRHTPPPPPLSQIMQCRVK